MVYKFPLTVPTFDIPSNTWSDSTFATREDFEQFVSGLIKEPGEYDFKVEEVVLWNEPARYFTEHKMYKGRTYPELTRDRKKWWDFEKKKCRKGVIFKDGDRVFYLTRFYYFWLNFLQIYDKAKNNFDFPEIWDTHYDLALCCVAAELNYKNIPLLKKRQMGASLFFLALIINSFWFEKGSVNKLGASLGAYLGMEDGCWKTIDFYRSYLNTHTDWYRECSPDKVGNWIQQREAISSDGKKTYVGRKSSIKASSFEKSPTQGVGGPTTYMFHEEGGIAPRADTTFGYMDPAMRSGMIRTGMFIISGSVGELSQCKPLEKWIRRPGEDFFSRKTKYFDEKGTVEDCGLFIPEQWSMPPYIDAAGNSLVQEAIKAIMIEREKWKEAVKKGEKTEEDYRLYVSQHPINIKEAFAWRENKGKYLAYLDNKIAETTRVLADPNVRLTEQARLKLQSELEGFTRSKENNLFILEKQQKLGSTEYLLPVLNRIRDIYDELGKKGVETGVLNGMLNNYIPSIVDSSQSSLGAEGVAKALENFYRLKVESFKTDSSMDRMFNTAKDLQAYLNTIDPKIYVHTDVATVTGAYMKSMNKAIAQKELINLLENTAVVGSNKGIIIEDAAAAMRDNYVSYTSRGAGLLEGKFVHPDYAPIIDQMFQRRDIGAIKNAFVQTAMLTKALNVVGSLFHAPSLGWAMAGASPKLIFKEIITAGSGIRKAVKDLESGELSEYTKLAIETGTKIGTEDVQRSVVADFGAYVDKKLFAGNKALGRVTGPLDKYVLQKMNTFTWDYMHTGGKLALFEDLMKKAERNLKEVPGTEEYTKARFALAKRISNSVNFTMGGLQWLQAANSIKSSLNRQLALHGTGIESRAWGQVAMFAPDWTVSTLGSFLKGMPSSLDIKGGIKGVMSPMNEADLSRRYMINTGLLYLTLLDAINLGTSGQHIWQNEDPTRIQHADGTTQQLAKHSMEFFHWLIDPAKTFKAKLGFVPKAGLALLDDQGGDYFQRAGTILKLAAPFSVGSALQAPEGEEIKRFVSSSAGFPVYGKPDAYLRDPTDVLKEKTERKLVRRENRMERVEEIQRKAERSQMRGLFEDFF